MKKKVLLVICISLVFPSIAVTQQIIRQSLSSLGTVAYNTECCMVQTMGQPSNTKVFYQDNLRLKQGFLQPVRRNLPSAGSTGHPVAVDVYPNPFCESFVILIRDNRSGFVFNLTDITGKRLLDGEIRGNSEQHIFTGTLNKGVYLILIYSGKALVAAKKVIKY
ncbi:MAG: T9SS type A sorting domain-containing protein [Bacteroidota bacterium]